MANEISLDPIVVLALAKKYTEETAKGGGAIAGKNIIVKGKANVTDAEGHITGVNLTVGYTLNDGTEKEEVLFLPAGPKGEQGEQGEKGEDGTALATKVSANETAIADRYTKAETDDLIEGEHIELTQAQYTALPEEEKMNGKTYFITDGGAYVPAVDLIPYVNQVPIVVGKLDLRGDGEFRDIKRVRLWINDLKNASEVITAGWVETGVYVRPIRIYGWFTFHDTEETQTSWTYRIQQLPIPYSGYNPIGAPSGNTIGLKFYVDYNNKLRMIVEGKSNFHTEDHACVIVDFMETPVA